MVFLQSRPRALAAGAAAVGLLVAGAPAAQAQGLPVGGSGSHYYLAGAGNVSGRAVQDFVYGDPGDDVYFGDFVDGHGTFGGDGRDDTLVRRGNTFFVRGQGGRSFSFGDLGDTVVVGDWDGDGTDTLAIRRGNRFFVKNDLDTGIADYEFSYGDPRDTILVGNWDGDTSPPDATQPVTTDTIMVRRGSHYFVKNSTTTGIADYDFWFGEPSDVVLVGDWVRAPRAGSAGESGDFADSLMARRGATYFQAEEVYDAESQPGSRLQADTTFVFGDITDTAFTAQLEYTSTVGGVSTTLYGDGLGLRRAEG